MKFGVREICDVVFKAKKSGSLGSYNYSVGQPVLYIDSAKTSTIEGAASTVYATGGRGNSRLIAWEGEKTLTFTVEDALLSEKGLAILTGAGLWQNGKSGNVTRNKMPIHCYEEAELVLTQDMNDIGTYLNPPSITIQLKNSPLKNPFSTFIFTKETLELFSEKCRLVITGDKIEDNYLLPHLSDDLTSHSVGKYFPKPLKNLYTEFNEKILAMPVEERQDKSFTASIPVVVDYYTEAKATTTEFIIDAQNFAGYYYVEATTDFRRASDGKDVKAMITFPNVKVQSNFTFNMAATGDPSTFSFVMDAMPGYTLNRPNKKVLCEMEIVDDTYLSDASKIELNDSIVNDYSMMRLLKEGDDLSNGAVLYLAPIGLTPVSEYQAYINLSSCYLDPERSIEANGSIYISNIYASISIDGSPTRNSDIYYDENNNTITIPKLSNKELIQGPDESVHYYLGENVQVTSIEIQDANWYDPNTPPPQAREIYPIKIGN